MKDKDCCDICQADVDHDGYVECEACHKFYCSDHNEHARIHCGEALCFDCAEKTENKTRLTKKQFELAVQIKEAQDQLIYWENSTNWHKPEDETGYENYEQCRVISLEMYSEKLTELTGNPRGYLA